MVDDRDERLRDMPELLTTRQLADYLQVSASTLHQWRGRGRGPRSVNVGRHIRYKATDVLTWLDQERE